MTFEDFARGSQLKNPPAAECICWYKCAQTNDDTIEHTQIRRPFSRRVVFRTAQANGRSPRRDCSHLRAAWQPRMRPEYWKRPVYHDGLRAASPPPESE